MSEGGDQGPGARQRCRNRWELLVHNPFFVLGLDPGAGRSEIERQGAKLLALLAAGSPQARRFSGPGGNEFERSDSSVRAAMAELRDPVRRLRHEWWFGRLGG